MEAKPVAAIRIYVPILNAEIIAGSASHATTTLLSTRSTSRMGANWGAILSACVVFAGGIALIFGGYVPFGETIAALSGGSLIGINIPTTV